MSNPSTYYGPEAKAVRSLVSDGCFIEGEVVNCIISRGVTVEKGAKVENAIIDRNLTIAAGTELRGTQDDIFIQQR
jgi:glucose-1-phosphate adenylyltransferase